MRSLIVKCRRAPCGASIVWASNRDHPRGNSRRTQLFAAEKFARHETVSADKRKESTSYKSHNCKPLANYWNWAAGGDASVNSEWPWPEATPGGGLGHHGQHARSSSIAPNIPDWYLRFVVIDHITRMIGCRRITYYIRVWRTPIMRKQLSDNGPNLPLIVVLHLYTTAETHPIVGVVGANQTCHNWSH
jgi:hypothetical protein